MKKRMRVRRPGAPLLVFEFDRALAPALARPRSAEALFTKLKNLQKHCSIAVFSGRSTKDLREHLKSWEPDFLIGEHGLEGLPALEKHLKKFVKIPMLWREQIEENPEHLPARSGIFIENRRKSLALHYRESKNQYRSRRHLLEAILSLQPVPRVISGPGVLHLLPDEAPSRLRALEELIQLSQASRTILIGFDQKDPDFSLGLPKGASFAEPPPRPGQLPKVVERLSATDL